MCLSRPHSISGVAFAAGGEEIVASYVHERIYSFDTVRHAREPGSPTAASRSSYAPRDAVLGVTEGFERTLACTVNSYMIWDSCSYWSRAFGNVGFVGVGLVICRMPSAMSTWAVPQPCISMLSRAALRRSVATALPDG